jgi:predicted O-methyltransferase YrrM
MLYWLARRSAPGRTLAVEVGSYLGSSSLFIASALKARGKGSLLYCVDTWLNDAMSEGNMDTFTAFKSNTSGHAGVIRPLRGCSLNMAKGFDEPIDFLFIDGDHSYDGVKADVDAWFSKLKPGATVAFHDIGWAEGVQQVVREDVLPRVVKSGRLPNLFWATMK